MPETTAASALGQFTTWMPAIAALLGALCGSGITAWVHYKASERRIKADITASNRVKWIEELRDDVTSFLYHNENGFISLDISKSINDNGRRLELYEESRTDIKKARLLQQKIRLKLNLSERDHSNLLNSMEDIILIVDSDDNEKDIKYYEIREEIGFFSSEIFKSEWEKAKRGE